ncbi:MAG: SEC-C domain-containing protein [Terrisporobacter sp.]|uniref:YecA family protein n=1 Tax=Terrisporobacter sp. TaxID=1965305 RepID=UPI002FC6DB29
MIGRNELCPCGSGKKYKKCCLQKNQLIEFTKNKTMYAKGLYKNLESKIIEYSNQEIFREDKEGCKKYFYISDVKDNKIDKLFKTYYLHDYTTQNKKVIANMYVEDNEPVLSKIQKNILLGMFNSYVSLFRVEEIKATKALVKDIFTNENISIEDIDLFKNLCVGECIIGRPIKIQDMNVFIDPSIKVCEKNVDIIVKNVNELYKTNNKNIIGNIKEFLMYNSEVIYNFAQQILINGESYIVKTQLLLDENKQEKDNDHDIYELLKGNMEEEYLQQGIDLWEEFLKVKKSITGSENGWAAAIEYYVKKDAGETITQVQISKKYEVSPRTLGKRYKELKTS